MTFARMTCLFQIWTTAKSHLGSKQQPVQGTEGKRGFDCYNYYALTVSTVWPPVEILLRNRMERNGSADASEHCWCETQRRYYW